MLYPNIETYCDLDDVSSYYEPSCLEKNCSQIFVKGPIMTREILDKVNSEIVPKKTFFCGKKFKTRRLIYLTGLIILFLFSTFGTVALWFTDSLNDFILTKLVIRNDSNSFDMWQKPPVKPLYKVYIFNYTNHESYQNGYEAKLKVQELGPYVYEQTGEKVNLLYDEDTITYQQNHSYKFRPDLSKGRISSKVWVPNIPLISGAALSKNLNYFSRLGLSALFSALEEEPFIELTVESYISGYESRLASLSQFSEPFTDMKGPEKVGLMAEKAGLQPEFFTVNIGKNITKFATIEKINNETQLYHFSTDECNSFSSTDGSIFPPEKVQSKQTLYYFLPEMCRKFPLEFSKETTILDGKVPAFQYILPDDVYDYTKLKNQCYCGIDGMQCPMNGLYNVSMCVFGAPMFASQPHFYRGDPRLFEHIDGLNPNRKDYTTKVNLHPTLGFMMTGKSTLQINIQVHKVYPIHQLNFFNDDIILPLAWFEVILEEHLLSPALLDVIHESTFTVERIEKALKYGTLLTSLVTVSFIALILSRICGERKRTPTNRRASRPAEYDR